MVWMYLFNSIDFCASRSVIFVFWQTNKSLSNEQVNVRRNGRLSERFPLVFFGKITFNSINLSLPFRKPEIFILRKFTLKLYGLVQCCNCSIIAVTLQSLSAASIVEHCKTFQSKEFHLERIWLSNRSQKLCSSSSVFKRHLRMKNLDFDWIGTSDGIKVSSEI